MCSFPFRFPFPNTPTIIGRIPSDALNGNSSSPAVFLFASILPSPSMPPPPPQLPEKINPGCLPPRILFGTGVRPSRRGTSPGCAGPRDGVHVDRRLGPRRASLPVRCTAPEVVFSPLPSRVALSGSAISSPIPFSAAAMYRWLLSQHVTMSLLVFLCSFATAAASTASADRYPSKCALVSAFVILYLAFFSLFVNSSGKSNNGSERSGFQSRAVYNNYYSCEELLAHSNVSL